MNFRPDLAALVMAGEKTVTRRLTSDNPRSPWYVGGCKLKRDRTYAVCPGRGKEQVGRVRVLATELMPLGHLDDLEAEQEGFASPGDFEDGFAGINGSYDPDALVWRVDFALASREEDR